MGEQVKKLKQQLRREGENNTGLKNEFAKFKDGRKIEKVGGKIVNKDAQAAKNAIRASRGEIRRLQTDLENVGSGKSLNVQGKSTKKTNVEAKDSAKLSTKHSKKDTSAGTIIPS